ncbi:Short-chain dehydrogenase [Chitinophaga costaii]|uniref:Short-chain dehydrogenase n=1 Tax=Chitinophaga costaii TaxID=1335309 RepID=A0A1C4AMA7_9BACT|nr:SDR family oxidoreductase [Chitinophaga costaii]PUZ26667.1 SDR family NAD(P)-dependent oxidoreductase [Chitinophaga costaii]SCB95770.1 Short-chain dehydrogenase [Chitinophaga costaii]
MNAVVTGASKGIGRAVAIRLAREGCNVAICARHEATLQATAAVVQAANDNVKVLALSVDMADKKAVIQFGKTVQEAFGDIDLLVNNAGIFIPGALQNEADGHLEQLMATNVYSAYHLTRTILPGMIARRSGHIFNLCSSASHQAYPNGGAYGISKFALLGFSKNLREELKTAQVKVTAISPGPTLTASWDGFDAPPGRMMEPEDVAHVLWTAFTLAPQTVIEDILMQPMLGPI